MHVRTLRDLMIQGREAAGLRQEDAAEKIGISQPHLSRIEQGKRFPTAPQLNKMVEVYSLDQEQAWRLFVSSANQDQQPEYVEPLVRAFEQGDIEVIIALFKKYHLKASAKVA